MRTTSITTRRSRIQREKIRAKAWKTVWWSDRKASKVSPWPCPCEVDRRVQKLLAARRIPPLPGRDDRGHDGRSCASRLFDRRTVAGACYQHCRTAREQGRLQLLTPCASTITRRCSAQNNDDNLLSQRDRALLNIAQRLQKEALRSALEEQVGPAAPLLFVVTFAWNGWPIAVARSGS